MRQSLGAIFIVMSLLIQASCSRFEVTSNTPPAASTDEEPVIDNSPKVVARYQFENNWNDSVGTNHGAVVNPTLPTFSTDKLLGTYAADLSVQDSRVNLGTSSTLTPTNVTISFWLKRTGASSGSSNVILWTKPCQWDSSEGFYVARESTGKAITLIVSGGNLIGLNDDPDNVFILNAWTHVAITFDSTTHEGHIYINGVDQPITSYGTPQVINPAAGATSKYIGSCDNGSTIDWPMDELTIINGVMSSSEVNTLYQTQKTAAGI